MQVYLATLEGVVTIEGDVDGRNAGWFHYTQRIGVYLHTRIALKPDWHDTFSGAAARVQVLIRNRLRKLRKEEKRLKEVAAECRAKVKAGARR